MKVSGVLPAAIPAIIVFFGCTSSKEHLLKMDDSQVKLQSMQTRGFETTDKEGMLRTVIATLQDFGFVIKKADEALGTITARRIDKYPLRITVTVRRRGEKQVLVRMNAYYGQPVRDPIIYQNFFASLANSMFLTANSIDCIAVSCRTHRRLLSGNYNPK